MLARKFLLGVGFAIATVTTATAQSNITDVEAIRILDVAGRQQMLSERIVKSACLSVAKINFGSNFDDMREAFEEFKTSHYGILNGSDALGIRASTFPEVTEALDMVSENLTQFTPYVDGVMNTGVLTATNLNNFNDRGLIVLLAMSETTDIIARVYAENLETISVGETITLNIAGRQRMLSQKMVKEMCLMHVNGTPSSSVGATIALFDASLNALVSGFPGAGIIAPPEPNCRKPFGRSQSHMDKFETYC